MAIFDVAQLARRSGKMKSRAQAQHRAVLRSIDLEFVSHNINQEIDVGEVPVSIEHSAS